MSGLSEDPKNETFDFFGIFRCNSLHHHMLTTKDWLNVSLFYSGSEKKGDQYLSCLFKNGMEGFFNT